VSAPPYMKLYVADYLADTTHLSRSEHGAYMLLLMAMWRAGGKLPADDKRLALITLATPKEWAAMKPAMLAFFQRRGSILTHKRVTAEMSKYDNTSVQRKAAGKAGGLKKANKNSGKSGDFARSNSSNSHHNQNQSQKKKEVEDNLLPLEIAETPVNGVAVLPKSSRLKPDWQPAADLTGYAIAQGFTPGEVERIAEDFRDYWTAQPGQKGVKLDWAATWRRWVRTQAERRPRRQSAALVGFV
jgi:uncharacterized protein YdaU (DUF1376 family)